jgi:DNA topoisomerase-1
MENQDGFFPYDPKYFQNLSPELQERIKKLHIPPNWTNVQVAWDPYASIQAIGFDSKGRKQYIYHQTHIQKAEKRKFLRIYQFALQVPRLNQILQKDNQLPIYHQKRVIALMLQLVRDYQLRVGKEVYARKNRSYGISSLRCRHVKIDHGTAYLDFRGKSGKRLRFVIRNPFYVENIKMLLRLCKNKNDHLFRYIQDVPIGHNGHIGQIKIKNITDRDLNAYLQKNLGKLFTVKDFRTYGANLYFVMALIHISRQRRPNSRKNIKRNILYALRVSAHKLKHTENISKKSYVMKFILDYYQSHPQYFIEHLTDPPDKILLHLFKIYQSYD